MLKEKQNGKNICKTNDTPQVNIIDWIFLQINKEKPKKKKSIGHEQTIHRSKTFTHEKIATMLVINGIKTINFVFTQKMNKNTNFKLIKMLRKSSFTHILVEIKIGTFLCITLIVQMHNMCDVYPSNPSSRNSLRKK